MVNRRTHLEREKRILYSQNFLRGPEVVESVLRKKCSLKPTDTVYEIGPGTGVITEVLARYCQRVVAVEIDHKLCSVLRKKFAQTPNVKIVQGDFLEQSLPRGPWKVFTNTPFGIFSKIVEKLTEAENPPEDAYLFAQEEAAQKFTGKLKTTLAALLLFPNFEVEIIHKFRRSDFVPRPGVDIVLLRMKQREKPLVPENQQQLYRDFVVHGFTCWRANIRQIFKEIFTYPQIKRLGKDLGFSLRATPSQLNAEQWLGLFDFFSKNVPEAKKQVVHGAEGRLRRQQEKLRKIHRTRTDPNWRRFG